MTSFQDFGDLPTPPDFPPNQVVLFGNTPQDDQPRENLLEFVRLDRVYEYTGRWVYKRTDDPPVSTKDEWDVYSFSVVREWDRQNKSFTVFIHIKNPLLREVLHEAMGDFKGMSWTTKLLKITPQTLMTFMEDLITHKDQLKSSEGLENDKYKHLNLLIDFLQTEHRETLEAIGSMVEHREMTFDLLWSIMKPNQIFFTRCPYTREPMAVKLISSQQLLCGSTLYWSLNCEQTDMTGSPKPNTLKYGTSSSMASIWEYEGTLKITTLSAFPMKYHENLAALTNQLIERGRKWASYSGVNHVHYQGTAYKTNESKVTVSGRCMIDRITYKRVNPNAPASLSTIQKFGTRSQVDNNLEMDENDPYSYPGFISPPSPIYHRSLYGSPDGNIPNPYGQPPITTDNFRIVVHQDDELTDEQLMMATPLLYGFSLSDKMWLSFNVNTITAITWQEDAFDQLVLPSFQKSLIRSLVEGHKGPDEENGGMDDFIVGKGRGLIINVFGPPGVGKTLSAEATSEHVKRPLYVVGVGEMGQDVEANLKEIFHLGFIWNAIVLIDEADVFMEQRSVNDLERNRLVAIFLRELEYYRGILFLTTNRVKVFDEAFQSRIHISLHYSELSIEAKEHIWKAFFKKAGMDTSIITSSQWSVLLNAKVNGRQIKNAARSGHSIAESQGERMNFQHVEQVLHVMSQFSQDFKTQNASFGDEKTTTSGKQVLESAPKAMANKLRGWHDWQPWILIYLVCSILTWKAF